MFFKYLLTLSIWSCCHSLINLRYIVAASILSNPSTHVTLTPGHEIALNCVVADYPDAEFTWHRIRHHGPPGTIDGREEQMLENPNKYIIDSNNLILKSPTMNDAGDYICRVREPIYNLMENQKVIPVRARPYIYDFDLEFSTTRSAIVEEGNQLKLVCNVVDDEKLVITWQMSKYEEDDMNEVHSGEDGISIETYNATSKALIIDKLTKDHRRFYRCNVTNGITDNSKVILIRVKDKYTVIWPTVGIFIELAILLGVIFVVDSRKVEPDLETPESKIDI